MVIFRVVSLVVAALALSGCQVRSDHPDPGYDAALRGELGAYPSWEEPVGDKQFEVTLFVPVKGNLAEGRRQWQEKAASLCPDGVATSEITEERAESIEVGEDSNHAAVAGALCGALGAAGCAAGGVLMEGATYQRSYRHQVIVGGVTCR